jgi:excisionase family DNA binding protein
MADRGERLTVKKAAEIAELTEMAIRAAANKGRLKAEKFGRDWVIYRKDLEDWLAHNEHRPGRPRKNSSD